MSINNNNNNKNREVSKIVAGIHGVSQREVQLVIAGDRENEAILKSYMEYIEGKSRLIQAIEKLVPFN